jgi:hypothetical protein
MPRHTFPKGHKFSTGGKREGAGRPTDEKRAEKLSFLQALERKREELADKMAAQYYVFAKTDPATMRHLVDRVMPPAKVEIGVTAQHSFDREYLRALMMTPAGREAAEAVTRALMQGAPGAGESHKLALGGSTPPSASTNGNGAHS